MPFQGFKQLGQLIILFIPAFLAFFSFRVRPVALSALPWLILELVSAMLLQFMLLPSLFMQIRRNIGPNFVAGFCLGIAVLAAVARQVKIRSREHDNRGSVGDLVRRGQLKSGQRGKYVTNSLKLHLAFSSSLH